MFSRHPRIDRRRFLVGGGAALLGTSLLSGCDSGASPSWLRRVLDKDEDANLYIQRLLLSDRKLAPEFSEADISPWFKPNGTEEPKASAYQALVKDGFKTFSLDVGGLVQRPQSFDMAALRAMPSRTQITRHDCVEGWSCIGKWTGVPMGDLLKAVGIKPQARFIVFYCADKMDDGSGLEGLSDADDDTTSDASGGSTDQGTPKASADGKSGSAIRIPADRRAIGNLYYESMDLEDAFHPQTILAYDMNGTPLPVAHGAPLRIRLERQLGYKMAKYVMQIEVTDSLAAIGKGGGGYWEDQGYEWYAGI